MMYFSSNFVFSLPTIIHITIDDVFMPDWSAIDSVQNLSFKSKRKNRVVVVQI